MTTNFVKINKDAVVKDIIKKVQDTQAETIEDIYVVDKENKLQGVLKIRDVLVSEPQISVAQIMQKNLKSIKPYIDQEEVAKIAERHNLNSIPVVNDLEQLIGVITLNDILQVVHQEAAEDILKLAGTGFAHPIYDSYLNRVRRRLPWLFITMGMELFLALVIGRIFHITLERLVILAAFIPVIMATGGNVGLQSSAIIVRGLAVGTISIARTFNVILSEILVGILIGAICGFLAAFVGIIINLGQTQHLIAISSSIFLAMFGAITVSAFIGSAAPLFLFKLKKDPAISSGPFVTSLNDLIGTTTYLLLATFIKL
jgi:magnesium transporter